MEACLSPPPNMRNFKINECFLYCSKQYSR